MIIEINNKLRERTIAFCNDELNYHIEESHCANEYHDEILAEIEILYLLGETEDALEYAKSYLENSKDKWYNSEPLSKKERKEVKDLIKMIKNGLK